MNLLTAPTCNLIRTTSSISHQNLGGKFNKTTEIRLGKDRREPCAGGWLTSESSKIEGRQPRAGDVLLMSLRAVERGCRGSFDGEGWRRREAEET